MPPRPSCSSYRSIDARRPIPKQSARQHLTAPDPAASHPVINLTGGFASLQPDDADYAVQVCQEQYPLVHVRRWYNGDPRQ